MPSEFSLIQTIQKLVGKPSSNVIQGIGDDTAVVRSPKNDLLATVDMMVEGVHFDLSYCIPQEIGHKSLAVNLSDIASMGGKPLYALVSLGVADSISTPFIKDLYRGMRTLGNKYGVHVIGGNIARSSKKLIVDVALIGEAQKKTILRNGAKPGNLLAVTGSLGSAACGLVALKKLGRNSLKKHSAVVRHQLVPKPLVREGKALAATGVVTSMIDVSDGLSAEVHHLAERSKVGFRVYASKIPMLPSMVESAEFFSADPFKLALEGGEDYQLLFSFQKDQESKVRSALKRCGKKLSVIGETVNASEGISLQKADGKWTQMRASGWDHLAHRSRRVDLNSYS